MTLPNDHNKVMSLQQAIEFSRTLAKHNPFVRMKDRLRGDYQDVFTNFEDEINAAPKPKEVKLPEYWDDDIAF